MTEKSAYSEPVIDDAKAQAVRATLISWFRENRRDLPWRHTRDPYEVLVSEVMLQQRGFEVLPRRWVVERTFSWLGQNRRTSKDYERLCATGEAFIYVAMSRLMVRRLARLMRLFGRFQEGVFSETGLPIRGVLGNSVAEKDQVSTSQSGEVAL